MHKYYILYHFKNSALFCVYEIQVIIVAIWNKASSWEHCRKNVIKKKWLNSDKIFQWGLSASLTELSR